MDLSYNHLEIEPKWQKKWEESKVFKFNKDSQKKKKYVLDMFPYPSGAGLHVGHPEGYTATDIYSRYLRMKNFEVIHPIGWDAFGLPAENYAIKIGVHPKKSTKENIENFTKQIKNLGFSYDWDQEINTSSPEYYKWSQWFFLLLYKNNLAYKKKAPVNWCESCKTVLANEQVVNGKCERCKSQVIQKDLEQWFFKVTEYANQLIDDLDKLDWPEALKTMQRNWIGRSHGAEIDFKISDSELKIRIFTTRPDTLYGATYMVLAPEHKLVQELKNEIGNFEEIENYIIETKKKSNLERTDLNKNKTGVELKNIKAINPANGKELPVYISDYVLASYGTGAIMCVPAHDQRDFEFAKKFNLPIIPVVQPKRKALILHGLGGNSKENWFPWIKKELENIGYEIITPDMPDSEKPVLENWLHNCETIVKDFGEDDIIIGHSLGGSTAIQLISKYDLKIDRLFLISTTSEFMFSDESVRASVEGQFSEDNINFTRKFLENKVDYQKVQNNIQKIYTYYSTNDKYISLDQKDKLNEVLKSENIILENKGHFSSDCQEFSELLSKIKEENRAYSGGVGKMINSEEFNDIDSEKAKEKIIQKVDGEIKTQFKIRDWLVSRQRYWGAPIPIIYCEKCGIVPVPESDLPVLLPDDIEDFRPNGQAPLASSEEFNANVKCPKCGGEGKREHDTMDGFVDNSWYYYRYLDPKNEQEFCSKEIIEKFMPVDSYVGGAEHAVGHLIYSRFFTKVLRDNGYLDFDEPFLKLTNQGLILGTDGQKMSKSLGNVVNPDEVVEEYGADSFRMYEMFMGPLEDSKPWNIDGIKGLRRFLDKNWNYFSNRPSGSGNSDPEGQANFALHKTIKKITEDIENFSFNTAISSLMIYFKKLSSLKNPNPDLVNSYLIMLSTFAPHICEEIWNNLGNKNFIAQESWPSYDENLIKEDKLILPIQINGKLRATLEADVNISEEELKEKVLILENVQKFIEGKEIIKFIYVQGKIINIVI